MGHAHRLDHILHRGAALHVERERALAPGIGQEVIQVAVEAHCQGVHVLTRSAAAHRLTSPLSHAAPSHSNYVNGVARSRPLSFGETPTPWDLPGVKGCSVSR